MDINILLEFIKEDTAEFVAITTVLVSVLSQFLVMIEYFRLKGRWDFYKLDEVCRVSRKSGFNIEYLVTSLFIIMVTSYEIEQHYS